LASLPRLKASGEEARAVAAFFPKERRTLLLREQATVRGLRDSLARADGRLRAVHIASHGLVDADHPRLSGLVLTGAEVLSLEEICRLKVAADLVVLSACETARGRHRDGEGVIGLVRGFFFAGAPRVVVTDWKVEDRSTRVFMEDFYRRMVRDGLSPSEALRAAKLARLRAGGAMAHPHHWAGFVLWGVPE
jgi:CHAT domain-containing protein